jgi:hypothetical protein
MGSRGEFGRVQESFLTSEETMSDIRDLIPAEIRAECFMVCDGAQECNGKLYILGGGWDVIFGQSFPLTYSQFAFAIRLSLPWTEANRPHPFEIQILEEDQQQNILPHPLRGEINVGRPPMTIPGQDLPVALSITMGGLVFPNPGTYVVRLTIDDREKAMLKLHVRKVGG